ncbi:2OG-Fe(II) oxygenase [Lysobacter sp. CA199]|uniref:2OG-Fe(II) oxygenase n=1 Tax=Lysobacter sp. CA199 TaxID=3455608 RepID=UPI003F8D10EB
MDRFEIGSLIEQRLARAIDESGRQWQQAAPIHYFIVDDLLPVELAMQIRQAFPQTSQMMLRKSLRELKYISAQMDRHAPILEEIIFAFQQPAVVEQVRAITALRSLYPDEHLYAGGISVMGRGHFLNPHLDNSHDKDRERYRVLNLLYYVSPDWQETNGGNLEVWPDGPDGRPTTIVSRFNRLAVMVTNQHSWHSVSTSLSDELRCCVSNYYFSDHPAASDEYFHPTSFRGRPDQPVRDIALRADAAARGWLRKLFPKGVRPAKHVYNKDR